MFTFSLVVNPQLVAEIKPLQKPFPSFASLALRRHIGSKTNFVGFLVELFSLLADQRPLYATVVTTTRRTFLV